MRAIIDRAARPCCAERLWEHSRQSEVDFWFARDSATVRMCRSPMRRRRSMSASATYSQIGAAAVPISYQANDSPAIQRKYTH